VPVLYPTQSLQDDFYLLGGFFFSSFFTAIQNGLVLCSLVAVSPAGKTTETIRALQAGLRRGMLSSCARARIMATEKLPQIQCSAGWVIQTHFLCDF